MTSQHQTRKPGRELAIQLLTAFALGWGLAWLAWRIGFSRGGSNLGLFIAVLGLEIYAWLRLALFAFVTWRVPVIARPEIKSVRSVDIFISTFHEDPNLVRATLIGTATINYPHTTYLLDDSNRESMRGLAKEFGATYISRSEAVHARAGLINHALPMTNGELILLLNADQVPMPDTLHALVGHFEDESVAFVQTPIEYANRDSVLHRGEELHERSLHNEVIAPARHARGAAVFEGSASLVSHRALTAIGGLSTESTTYDMATSMMFNAAGFKGAYHPEVVVQGQAPHNLKALLTERARWARGELSVGRSGHNPVIRPGLKFGQRLVYIQPMVEHLSGLFRFAQFAMLGVVLITAEIPFNASALQLGVGFGISTLLAGEATYQLGRKRARRRERIQKDLLTMQAMLGALLAAFLFGKRRFRPVKRTGVDHGGLGVLDQLRLLTALTAGLEIALILRMADALLGKPLAPQSGLALVATIAVAFYLLKDSLNVLGVFVRRRQHRAHYRIGMSQPALVNEHLVKLRDLTASGASFITPRRVAPGDEVTLVIRLPRLTGGVDEMRIEATVRSALPNQHFSRWRVGCLFKNVESLEQDQIIEYCSVTRPFQLLRTG